MKKIALITVALIWILSLIILTVALTDIYPNNPFKEHRFIVGIGFISLTGFLRIAYNQILKIRPINEI